MSAFAQLVNDFLEAVWAHDSLHATRQGIHRHDYSLPDRSADAVQGWGQTLRGFQGRFEAVDTTGLTRAEQLDHQWALAVLDRELLDVDLGILERDARLHLQSIGTALNAMLIGDYAPAEERFHAILARLNGIPAHLAEIQHMLQPDAMPPLWIDYGISVAGSQRNFLSRALPQAARAVPVLETEVTQAAHRAAQAMDDFAAYLRSVGPRAKGEFGVGREAFDRILQRYHMLDLDADQLYAIGLDWIDRYEREMTEVAKAIDPHLHWLEALERVKDDHPAGEDFLKAYTDETLLAKQHCLDLDLITIPPGETCVLDWTPEFMRPWSPIAMPWSSPIFEPSLLGRWYVTPLDATASPERQRQHMRDNSWPWIRGIAQHEIYPGHHLHNIILKQVGTPLRKMFRSPTFIEGWGLYTEELWYETGPLKPAPMRLMQLRNGLWRAVRIIIDVGMHARGMTADESVRLLVERARLEPRWAEAETRVYTTRPTYFSCYRVGLTEVLTLREKYKAKLGSDYSLKKFHDTLMSYSVLPMKLIEAEMLA